MSLQFPSSLELFNTSVLESLHTNASTTAKFSILGIIVFLCPRPPVVAMLLGRYFARILTSMQSS